MGMNLKPQDVVVALKLFGYPNGRPPMSIVASDLGLSPSEVHGAIQRLRSIDISRAAPIFKQLHEWEAVPELHAGLQTLRATGSPLLSSQHRATLAVRGLESLLLPEVEIPWRRKVCHPKIGQMRNFHKSGDVGERPPSDLVFTN